MATNQVKREATLVLLHAMGNDVDCWQVNPDFWRFLQREGAVPYVLPGDTGRGRKQGWTVESMADEIVAKVPGPIDILGIANGGVIIQAILERHPARVRSAILVNCRAATARSATPVSTSGKATPMADLLEAGLKRWFTPFAVRADHPGVVHARKEFLRMDPEAYRDFQLAAGSFALKDPTMLTRLTQPVSLISGMDDASLPGQVELHRMIPKSRQELISGRHFLHLEHPENLMSAIYHHMVWLPIANRVEPPLQYSTLGQVGEWSLA